MTRRRITDELTLKIAKVMQRRIWMSKCESSAGRMMLTGENRSTRSVILFTTNSVWTALVLSPSLRGVRPTPEVQFTLEQATKALRGSRGIALLVP